LALVVQLDPVQNEPKVLVLMRTRTVCSSPGDVSPEVP